MWIVKQVQILVGLALLGAASFALADVPTADSPASAATPETVVVVGTTWNCSEASTERARSLADKASQDGAYQRAGECYLAAGEHALANETHRSTPSPSPVASMASSTARFTSIHQRGR